MKKLLLSTMSLLMLSATAMADGRQTVTINGQIVAEKATMLTFAGDEVNVFFDYGTAMTADMEQVSISFDWSLLPTAIESVRPETSVRDEYYDLNGRKLTTDRLTKGVYIMRQGKKVVKFVKP